MNATPRHPPGAARRPRPDGRHRRQPAAGNRAALAALEFVVVLPVLLTIAFGCIDFGRVAHHDIAVANAARVGAEYGATNTFTTWTRSSWEAQLRTRVLEELAHSRDSDPDTVQVIVDVFPNPDGTSRIDVEVVSPFTTIVNWPGIPAQVDVRRRVAMLSYR